MEIARREVIKLREEVDEHRKDIRISRHHEPWNRCMPLNENRPDHDKEYYKFVLQRWEKLSGKEYWAVSFDLAGRTFEPGILWVGGSECFFVDVNTGEVLADYLTK